MDKAIAKQPAINEHRSRRRPLKSVSGTISVLAMAAVMPLAAAAQQGHVSNRVTVRFVESHRNSIVETLPTYVAEEKQLFNKYGIDVEFLTGSGGGTTMRLLSTHNADVADAGAAAAILAARSDPNIELIGAWYHSASAMKWIAPEGKASTTSGNLSGAKLGYSRAGSTSQFLAEESIRRAGVKHVSFVSVGGMGDNWAAAKGGAITAGWAMAPFLEAKINNHQAKVVLDPGKYIHHFYVGAIDVRKNFAEAHPKAIQAVFRGLNDAVQFIADHPEQAAAIGAKRYGYPKSVIAAGIKEYLNKDFWDFKVDFQAFKNVINGMVKTKSLSHKIDIRTVLNQNYLPKRDKSK